MKPETCSYCGKCAESNAFSRFLIRANCRECGKAHWVCSPCRVMNFVRVTVNGYVGQSQKVEVEVIEPGYYAVQFCPKTLAGLKAIERIGGTEFRDPAGKGRP